MMRMQTRMKKRMGRGNGSERSGSEMCRGGVRMCVWMKTKLSVRERRRRRGVVCVRADNVDMERQQQAAAASMTSDATSSSSTSVQSNAQKIQNAQNRMLHSFGKGRCVPRRPTTLADLRLHRIQAEKLLSPRESTIIGVRRGSQLALWITFAALLLAGQDTLVVSILAAVTLTVLVDAALLSGAIEFLLLDSLANSLVPEYRERVALHEAGHFLVAYLLGVLPTSYTLAAAEALIANNEGDNDAAAKRQDEDGGGGRGDERWDAAGPPAPMGGPFSLVKMQAGTKLNDDAFQAELAGGTIRSGTLDTFACIALAGISAEYLRYGAAEGGMSDVKQLDAILTALGFTQRKADDVVRWAVLNTVNLLRTHETAHRALADAMMARESIDACIGVVEDAIDVNELMVSDVPKPACENSPDGSTSPV